MAGLLILGAAITLTPSPASQTVAWPAMREGGANYAIATEANRISQCLPLNTTEDATKTKAACAALIAKGIPAGIVPATTATRVNDWLLPSEYPVNDMKAGASASVTLIYEVDEGGSVNSCVVSKGSGIAKFDEAACSGLIQRAHFTPASYKGKPVHAAAIVTFSFEHD
ncbi:TonB family protein [Sphingomonas kyeonggiensis]|uniref:energy transducer TonB n=1 Tax=Sphingomonas kyeonggiensis TaxID=1268553 RepID=UPI002780962A|nr:energy transducer TonB [Sphingomonas kyeonggiensis]MDQ0249018.1 TonB family protein [Sphingomonas kyeonggiensis]